MRGLKTLTLALSAVFLLGAIPDVPSRADTGESATLELSVNMEWLDYCFESDDHYPSFENIEENIDISYDGYLLSGNGRSCIGNSVVSEYFSYFFNYGDYSGRENSLRIRLNGRDAVYIPNDLKPLNYNHFYLEGDEMVYYLYDWGSYDALFIVEREEESESWAPRDIVTIAFVRKSATYPY